MAVKKASAKKPAKKAVAKKAVAKKAVAKKPAKKAVAKKAASKKPAVRKSSAAKKAPIKKTAAKKPAKKAAAKKAVLRFDVPEAPVVGRPARLEVVSTPAPAPALTSFVKSAPTKANGPSRRVIFALGIGVILLVAIVSSRAGNKSDDAAPAPAPTQSESVSAEPSMSASETPSETPAETPAGTTAMLAAHEAPGKVVANYTDGSAKAKAVITWSAPAATEGLTGYNVEISIAGGAFKIIATVPATVLAQDISKTSSEAWTSFKVSSVYSDSEVTAAKAFGLTGTWG